VVDEKEIPDAMPRRDRDRDRDTDRNDRQDRGKGAKSQTPGRDRIAQGAESRGRENGETARVFVGLGRKDGIRAGDLVGAIANETNLSGREIGPIKLAEHFSIVGVPEWSTDDVISALKATTLKGKRATVRRYTD
jgi:ATP-dependent RNA helicase DeaD